MLIWNGEAIIEVLDSEGEAMIKKGEAVAVGPFDGLRAFPSKEEMRAAVKPQKKSSSVSGSAQDDPQAKNTYATKDLRAKE